MMKLIKNEFIKFTYQQITLFYFIILALVISCLVGMPYKFMYLVKSDITQYQTLFKFTVSKVILPALLIFAVVKASSLILSDFKNGTIKNIVVRRCSRFKIYIMRVISLFLYITMMMVIFIGAIVMYFYFSNQENILSQQSLQQWLVIKISYFLLILFYLICLSIFIAAITNNTFVSAVIITLYTIYVPLNYQLLSTFYNEYKLINILNLLPSYQISHLQFYSNNIVVLSTNNLVLTIPILIGSALVLFLVSCFIYRLRERRLV